MLENTPKTTTHNTHFTPDELRHWAFFVHAQDPSRVHNRSTENVIMAALKPEAIEAETDVARVVSLFRADPTFIFDQGYQGVRTASTCGMPLPELARLVLDGKIPAMKRFSAIAVRRDDGDHYQDRDGRRWVPLTDCPADRDLEGDSRPPAVEIERAVELPVWPSRNCHIYGRPAESRWGIYRICDAVRFMLCAMGEAGTGGIIPECFLDRGNMWEAKPSYAVVELPRSVIGDQIIKDHNLTALVSSDSVSLPVALSTFDGGGIHTARWPEVPGEHILRGSGRLHGSSQVTPFAIAAPGRGSWLTMGQTILTADFDGQSYQIKTPGKAGKK